VEMSDSDISALVARGYLAEEARTNPKAIKTSIESVISDLSFELEQERFKGSGSHFWAFGRRVKSHSAPSLAPTSGRRLGPDEMKRVTMKVRV